MTPEENQSLAGKLYADHDPKLYSMPSVSREASLDIQLGITKEKLDRLQKCILSFVKKLLHKADSGCKLARAVERSSAAIAACAKAKVEAYEECVSTLEDILERTGFPQNNNQSTEETMPPKDLEETESQETPGQGQPNSQDTQVSELPVIVYSCLDAIQDIVSALGGSREICRAIACLGNSHTDMSVLDELRYWRAKIKKQHPTNITEKTMPTKDGELQDPPTVDNELVVDHMLKALYNLQMAYNAAKNSGLQDAAWGIAIAVAETNAQCEGLGIIPRHGPNVGEEKK